MAAAVDVFEQAGDMTQTYIDLKAVNEDYTQCFARYAGCCPSPLVSLVFASIDRA